jgi:predicted metal-dependent hydrolase
MMQEFAYGSKKIVYCLKFSRRKTLGITVTPEMDVLVKAPEGASPALIEEKLAKRATWILRQQNYFLQFFPRMPEKEFRGGESHFYLGRQYRLRVKLDNKNDVNFTGREIEVYHTQKSSARSVLTNWYHHRAKTKFPEFAEPWIQQIEQYGVQPEGLFIQKMPTRWGSCTAKGKIILNPELIKAPRICIEYVIIHELCHLVHRHHTQKFFLLQSTMMPDWERWKNKLESMIL